MTRFLETCVSFPRQKRIFMEKRDSGRTDYTLPARVFRTRGITFYIADESRRIATIAYTFLVTIYILLYTYYYS